MRNKDDSTKRH
jgi:hypothetical protein